ncbi:MAG: putative DNA modification/repair radical SAM protein [Lentisphaeria bacterium]|nr:putative DNA modification/repair radical SAM protein [Lentisphaeria bacterium]
MTVKEKLDLLSGAAKYDASCASSGSDRSVGVSRTGMGSTLSCGVCHSWSDDGRCVSLLKLLYSNACVYDCAYCVNRRSNDVPRATFTVEEVVKLTTEFYKRNYIEGLFLSSGVVKNPDYTMERMIDICRRLREEENFFGYIHLKLIPGASLDLLDRAGRLADRVSVNIELPSAESLRRLAPDKHREGILAPMKRVGGHIVENRAERGKSRALAPYAPAGQSTQMIIGATPESDYHILRLSESLYQKVALKRVYYSAYIPVNEHPSLPAMPSPPLRREHRLYQADWLLRYYQFGAHELLDADHPFLDSELDPKVAWALRHLRHFPVEINQADYATLLRVPGIGVTSARRITQSRRWSRLTFDHLRKIGVVLKRAAYFITCGGKMMTGDLLARPADLRRHLIYDLKLGEWNQPLLPGWTETTTALTRPSGVSPAFPGAATPEAAFLALPAGYPPKKTKNLRQGILTEV